MKINIRNKILVGFALLLLLSALVQALTLSIVGDYIYKNLKNIQLIQAQKGVKEVQLFVSNLHKINYALATTYKLNSISSSSSAENSLSSSIKTELLENPQIKSISIITVNGRELIKYDQDNVNISQERTGGISPSEDFNKARYGTTTISKVYDSSVTKLPQIDFFTPIFSGGKVRAIIKMEIGLEKLRRGLSDIKMGDYGYILLVDDTGRLISYPSSDYVLQKPNLSKQKIIAAMLAKRIPTEFEEQYKNEKDIIVTSKAARVPGLNWIVVFEQPVPELLNFVNFLRSLFVFNLVGSLLVLLIVALLLSESFTGPIRKLTYMTEQLEQGKFDSSIKISSGDEIESLAKSFNSMAIRLLQREDYLKKQEQERETILQSLSDGIIAVNSDNKVELFNKESERITGLTGGTILYKNIDDVLRIFDNDIQLKFDQYKIRGQDLVLKLNAKGQYLLNSFGVKLKISLTTAAVNIDDPNQKKWVITIHDMRKELELEEMKLDFVSMAAHELRTPLTAIRGYASLLNIQNAEILDSNGKNLLAHLLVSTETLNNLIDNLLNISRIERNTLGVQMKPLNIDEIIKNVLKGLKQQAYISNQKMELELPAQQLPMVAADPFRIGQVISNLVINALNYTQEGSSIKIRAKQNDKFVEVSIADNGPGIKPEALPKLFTKFFRVSGQPEQGANGTGLGLFICKSIIELHKGKIWVESELNKGTTFTFSLPIASESIDKS